MKVERVTGGWRVGVGANELEVPNSTFGSVRLPYPTYLGVIKDSGGIDVWTPAAHVPRGYRRAAQAVLEQVRAKLKEEGQMSENPVSRPWASIFRTGLAEPGDGPRKIRLYLERVKLDSGGYDRHGRYYGRGLPLYRASDDRGDVDIELRANDRAHAKDLVRRRLGDAYDVRFTA